LHTSLDATEVIRTKYPRPVWEIYDELTSSAFTSLDTAAYFLSWDQARNTMYYSRAKRYPRLLAKRQDLRFTAEQTTAKSGAQFLVYHSPTNDKLIFATEAGVRLLAQSTCWCGNGAFKIVPSCRILEVLHSKAEKFGAFFQIPGYKVFASTFAKLCFSMSAGLA
ncbi:hypothetical protein T4D_7525, partial [Trichinella pseudospiralis]